jgi:hypothetical protein
MTTFQVGDRVTPKASDSKLGTQHGVVLIVVYIDFETNTMMVQNEDGKYLSGNTLVNLSYGPHAECYYSYRFELIESQKLETIEDRIKKLYRKCKTTKHWG